MAQAPAAIDGEVVAAAPASRRPSRKTLIVAGVALLLLLVAGGIAAFILLKPKPAATGAATADSTAAETYVDVPAMVVNLRSADGAPRLIKLHLMLVAATAERGPAITARLPAIIDRFQPFLRELRPDDLAGSAAVFRIKEELLLRANDAAGAGAVKDVLVQDLIQQ